MFVGAIGRPSPEVHGPVAVPIHQFSYLAIRGVGGAPLQHQMTRPVEAFTAYDGDAEAPPRIVRVDGRMFVLVPVGRRENCAEHLLAIRINGMDFDTSH